MQTQDLICKLIILCIISTMMYFVSVLDPTKKVLELVLIFFIMLISVVYSIVEVWFECCQQSKLSVTLIVEQMIKTILTDTGVFLLIYAFLNYLGMMYPDGIFVNFTIIIASCVLLITWDIRRWENEQHETVTG